MGLKKKDTIQIQNSIPGPAISTANRVPMKAPGINALNELAANERPGVIFPLEPDQSRVPRMSFRLKNGYLSCGNFKKMVSTMPATANRTDRTRDRFIARVFRTSICLPVVSTSLRWSVVYFLLFAWLPGLNAQTVELGLQLAGHHRFEDAFSRGIRKFRTSIFIEPIRYSDAEPMERLYQTEFFFRFNDFIGPEHYTGITIGSYSMPSFSVQHVESSGRFLTSQMDFNMTYFLLGYHYVRPMRSFLRGWRWEAGGGFGIIPSATWRVRGIQRTAFEIRDYSATHRARSGTMARLELAVSRPFPYSILRMGIRWDYALLGDFRGNLRDTDADYYTLGDGSIALLPDIADLATVNQQLAQASTSVFTNSAIREKTRGTFGSMGLFVSFGFRF